MSARHDWKETGRRAKHVEGSMFKYGTSVVIYVKCTSCGQIGFRFPSRRVIYTWERR